jgi:hypothetical protein
MITGITSNNIGKCWDGIKNAILDSNRKTDFLKMYPIEYVRKKLESRDWQCWVTDSAVFITSVIKYPSGYSVFDIIYACGTGMNEWNDEAWMTLSAFAKSKGCDEINFRGRKGWGRYGKKFEPDMKTEYRYAVKLC